MPSPANNFIIENLQQVTKSSMFSFKGGKVGYEDNS